MDDDPVVLGLVESILRHGGYRPLIAHDAWEAIRLFDESGEQVRLLLTDVVMPDLTGPVLASRLRVRRPDLNVLFISGYHDTALVQRFVGEQGCALLPKPFSPESLLKAVRDALGH